MCKPTLCGEHVLCGLLSLCEHNVSVRGKACVRTVCVTHLLCVGGLEALCCKGCGSVGLCGDGVVCGCEVVLGNYFGGGGVLWGWCCGAGVVLGHDRNFPKIFGARDKIF